MKNHRTQSRLLFFSLAGALASPWVIAACGSDPQENAEDTAEDASSLDSTGEDEDSGGEEAGTTKSDTASSASSTPDESSNVDSSATGSSESVESSDDSTNSDSESSGETESTSDSESSEESESTDDSESSEDSGTSSEEDSESTSGDDESSDTSGEDEGDDEGDDDSSDTDPKLLARNVELSLVEVTQGVQVVLSKDGEEVEPGDRNSDLIEKRGMLVRAHWKLGNGWKQREIEAVLTLKTADGKTESIVKKKNLDEDSDADRLDGTFNWDIEADKVLEGLALSVELREVDDSQNDEPIPDPAPRYPDKGQADLKVVTAPMEIHFKIIRAETESGSLEANDDHKQTMLDRLLDANPAQKVTLEVSDPIEHDNFENSGEMFRFLRELREEEDADPNVYYHLMLLRADHDMGWSGIASLPGDSKQAANQRVSITITRDNIARGAGTALHELGHNQGQRHAPCGGAAGPDPGYPYDEGLIGVQGYSLQRKQLYDPTEVKDYMSYCGPRWVSDYYWRAYVKRIRTLSSWSYGEGQSDLRGRTLIGWIGGDGSQEWQVVRGTLAENQLRRTQDYRARLWSEGVVSRELPIAVHDIEHTQDFEIYIPFGDHLNAESIDVQIHNRQFQVDRSDIYMIAK